MPSKKISFNKKVHKESLLQVPLIRIMLKDQRIKWVPRGIDANWYYSGFFKTLNAGFNPTKGEIYFPFNSKFAKWRRDPCLSARSFNEMDHLVFEALVAAHDYLHSWCAQFINFAEPKLGFGNAPITEKNYEDMVFLMMLTETAAAVGLDYWQMGEKEINDFCPIGSLRKNLTIHFGRHHRYELNRHLPELKFMSPDFVLFMQNFYCRDEVPGLSIAGVRQSPLLTRWLYNEFGYADTQRENMRRWLLRFALHPTKIKIKNFSSPIITKKKWQKDICLLVGDALIQLLKEKQKAFPFEPMSWASQNATQKDFNFLNLNEALPSDHTKMDKMLLKQAILRLDFHKTSDSMKKKLSLLVRGEKKISWKEYRMLTARIPKLAPQEEPIDIFLAD